MNFSVAHISDIFLECGMDLETGLAPQAAQSPFSVVRPVLIQSSLRVRRPIEKNTQGALLDLGKLGGELAVRLS